MVETQILVVDDEISVQEFLSAILAGSGYTVTVATAISDAEAHLDRQRFDALICDVYLDGDDGIALLHDIGKIGIPDNILRKPGPLTAGERLMIQTHPDLGYRILSGIGFLRNAANVVRYHHERYDGNGYPQGLAGDDIPLAARIFAVADVVDVLVHGRVYQGTHFFSGGGGMSNKSILIVDDEPEILAVLAELLSGSGYTVTTASGADEALDHLKDSVVDVVLTDIIMPEGEGVELIRAISRMAPPPAVIAMSGHPTGSYFFRAAELFGAAATLQKPFSPAALQDALIQVCG